MSSTDPLHVPLDKPPQAMALTVRALLARVQVGGIRVPAFQRPLRWRSDDVVKLFDSMFRGYPVGSLLFWKHAASKDDHYKIGGAILPVPANPDAWSIVDGQQRVTALAAALLHLDTGLEARWIVRFDPTTSTFLSGPVPEEEKGRVVPLSVLGDLRRLGRWLRDSTLDEAAQSIVEDVQQRLLDYELSAYLMETDRPEALQGVFARMNSTGVRMRSDEVFQALLGGPGPGRRGLNLNQLQAACDMDGFGQPPRREVLKAVLAMSGQDPTRRLEHMNEEAVGKLVNAEDAEAAIARAVAFLQSSPIAPEPGCGIPCYGFIPYPVVFVLLARWFFVFPEVSEITRRALAQWLWRGVITATHQRAAVSAMRLQSRLITGDSAEDAVDALSRAVGEPKRVDWTLDRFDARNARSRVELLALLSLGPMHRDGAVSWRALVSDGQRVAREIIRSAALPQLSPDSHKLVTSAANRALLDTNHTGLKTEFQTWDSEQDRDALNSHLIDEEMWHLLTQTDGAELFLRRRAAKVQALVSRFLTERAGLGSPRLAPVTRYADTEPELGLMDDAEEVAIDETDDIGPKLEKESMP